VQSVNNIRTGHGRLADSCNLSVLATDEACARTRLLEHYARLILDKGEHSYGNYAGKLEAWLAAGKPVREDTHRPVPDVRPLEDLLKPLKAPEPEPAAA
jgi:hypothetical protein